MPISSQQVTTADLLRELYLSVCSRERAWLCSNIVFQARKRFSLAVRRGCVAVQALPKQQLGNLSQGWERYDPSDVPGLQLLPSYILGMMAIALLARDGSCGPMASQGLHMFLSSTIGRKLVCYCCFVFQGQCQDLLGLKLYAFGT